jgi:glucosamine 6-phosphate synthetase-like amidotransferase/phosphosugar isomerase protein
VQQAVTRPHGVQKVFKEIDRVLILACGTNYYSGLTAKYSSGPTVNCSLVLGACGQVDLMGSLSEIRNNAADPVTQNV